MSEAIQCFNCGSSFTVLIPLSVRETCADCQSDLHCCRMCKNYSVSAHNECREPLAEKVTDKEKANLCDYFSLNPSPAVNDRNAAENAFKVLDDLFKK